MNTTYRSLILVASLPLAGCAIKHNYAWNEYAVAPERISKDNTFRKGQAVKIASGKSSDVKIFLGSVGAHKYYGSEQMLADAIAQQVSIEFNKLGLEVKDPAAKSLEIAVTGSRFEYGTWKIAADLNFTVVFGGGKRKSYSVRNRSPGTVNRTYNGAVALATIEILNDPEVRAYINE